MTHTMKTDERDDYKDCNAYQGDAACIMDDSMCLWCPNYNKESVPMNCQTCKFSSKYNNDVSCDITRGVPSGSCGSGEPGWEKYIPPYKDEGCDPPRCDECLKQSYTCGTFENACTHPGGDHDYFEPKPPISTTYKDEETTDGLKYDAAKVDMSFLEYFPLALEKICALSEFGAKKYSRGGFKSITDPKRYKAAMLRHYFKENMEDVDQDSGFSHDVATAWNALAALEIGLMNPKK